MANGNVTITNGKGATKNIGAEAFRLISKGTGVAKIRNEDWWIHGEEKPIVPEKSRPGSAPKEKPAPKKPDNNFVPQELVSMKETRELREKVKDLEGKINELSAENMELKSKLEAGAKTETGNNAEPPASPAPAPLKVEDPKGGKAAKLGPDGKPEKP